jgi:hypothetical protein
MNPDLDGTAEHRLAAFLATVDPVTARLDRFAHASEIEIRMLMRTATA